MIDLDQLSEIDDHEKQDELIKEQREKKEPQEGLGSGGGHGTVNLSPEMANEFRKMKTKGKK